MSDFQTGFIAGVATFCLPSFLLIVAMLPALFRRDPAEQRTPAERYRYF